MDEDYEGHRRLGSDKSVHSLGGGDDFMGIYIR